ncbi:discoidin domain-containing protein [Micromonospora sp. HM5-17]|uniref:discoidin domain-containing protein n=1 Tax=Micromonospora sp. HM5-17 TaxID=2487710 RepID=UPI000F4846BB|nr:discoidin domain-containing protein [Micromonospora sp. HM5-17]ROT33013.1 glycosyl hydrolase family protein [Micromonospora sp. HM5-17]
MHRAVPPPGAPPHPPRRRGRLQLATLAAALAGLLGGYLVVAAGPAGAAVTLLSQGRPATASSVESAAFPASAAVDGDPGTRWSSAFADPQWLEVDLGRSVPVSRVVLTWETAYARAFTIQISTDGTAWTTVHTTTEGTGGIQDLAVSGTGRYVRLHATARATPWGVSLWEFQVYGDPDAGPTTPPGTTPPGEDVLLSYGKPAVASSSQHDGNCWECTPARAFDNDPATRWATSSTTGWVDPGWIYVDLGATATIRRVVLQWDPAYATAYQIQVSSDASTWSTIYSTTTGRGFVETLSVNGTGRYVRMYGTARGSPYGYSLWEFRVYGSGGNPTPPPPQPPDPTFPATRLVFSDEFNGPAGAKPDPTKWTIDPGTGQNNELQYYTNNENAQMDGAGSLVLEARRESAGGREYTSHRMNTGTKFHVQYGRIEARIRVPKGNGLWPAFWMMGADFLTGRPWPYNGEIDIMEVLGRNTLEGYSTLHAPAYHGGGGYGQRYPAPGGVDLSAGFHVWAVEWDSRGMRFSLDGQTVFVADKAMVEATRGPWVFDHPFYLILNLAVGGDFPGPVDGTTPFPSRMYVDYVRVYQ